MYQITTISDLKEAILELEAEQIIKEKLFKEQLYLTCQNLRPANLLKNAFKEIISSSFLKENLLGTATGLATGYLSKKIIIGTSANILRKLFGTFLEFGVANIISQHPDTVKSFGQFIAQHLFRKKEVNPNSRDR